MIYDCHKSDAAVIRVDGKHIIIMIRKEDTNKPLKVHSLRRV